MRDDHERARMPRLAAIAALLLALVLAACDGGSTETDGGGDGQTAADGDDGGQGDAAADQDAQLLLISVQPDHGPLAGGSQVLLSGRGFVQGAGVDFGPAAATAVSFVSSYQLEATTPPAQAAGAVDVTVRNPGGERAVLEAGFEYRDEVAPTIGWCVLQSPAATETEPDQPSEPIYGRVYAAGCSDGDQHCQAVAGELGLGPVGSDPTQAPGAWSWTAAAYNPGHSGDDNDEYSAALTAAEAGEYAYAYRFSADGGGSWTYCDLNGSDDGFAPEQAGRLTVSGQQQAVGWCNLQYPAATSTVVGVASEPIFGQVYLADCTAGPGPCAAVSGQLGHGPTAADPSQDPDAYSWQPAEPNPEVEGDNDEWQASLVPAAVGDYGYAYRFSADGGDSWTYCDLNGSDDGFASDQIGSLTAVAGRDIGWCNLQHPATTTCGVGNDSEPFFGRVYVQGCTEGEARCGGLLAEVGYGPEGVDPSAQPEQFSWTAAAYNPGHTGDDNDEYTTAINAAAAGTYRSCFRFSGDGGQSWTYCDLDGSDDGFSTGAMGTVTVQD